MEREETYLKCYMKTLSTSSQKREIAGLLVFRVGARW